MGRQSGVSWAAKWGIQFCLLCLLAACSLPQLSVEVESANPSAVPGTSTPTPVDTATPTVSPTPTTTPTMTRTPGPSATPIPTLCAHARIAGQVCEARIDVTISTCCPDWTAITTSDDRGAFAFADLTAGTFTVRAGERSRQVTLKQCDSQVSVDLCPPPTMAPGLR